jgi:hypothetical protein
MDRRPSAEYSQVQMGSSRRYLLDLSRGTYRHRPVLSGALSVFPSQSVVLPVIATGGLGFTTTVTGAIAG